MKGAVQMATKIEETATATVVGRLAQKQIARTGAGVMVCRLTVLRKARGPASKPVRMDLYAIDAEAERCAFNLKAGDLIGAAEVEIGPERDGIRHQELLVSDGDVKLYERAGERAATA
jgi:hypothetical protein